jgi:pSer/pThr/pTyr-binding forkhead associated (FHA) protein
MNVKLVMANGPARGHVIQLREPHSVLGRQKECTVRIPSADVSRRHCALTFEDGVLYVEDLGSTNGTFINGERVRGREAIEPGDMLGIGPVMFRVKYTSAHKGEDGDAIPLVGNLDTAESLASQKTAQFDRPTESAAKTKPPVPVDNLDVVEEVEEVVEAAEEVLDVVEFNVDDEPLNLPQDGDFRDILSGLDGK